MRGQAGLKGCGTGDSRDGALETCPGAPDIVTLQACASPGGPGGLDGNLLGTEASRTPTERQAEEKAQKQLILLVELLL